MSWYLVPADRLRSQRSVFIKLPTDVSVHQARGINAHCSLAKGPLFDIEGPDDVISALLTDAHELRNVGAPASHCRPAAPITSRSGLLAAF